jgi:proliferating cell nuclear antigen
MSNPDSSAEAVGDVAQGSGMRTAAGNKHCLEIKTVQAVAFKVLVEALKELLTECTMEFDVQGARVVAMDTSHVVLVHLKLEASKFELYHCAARISIGINMLNLHKLLKTINNSDTLTLFIDADDTNHLCIKIENSEKNSRTTYKLNLLDLDSQKIHVDPTEFSSVLTLPCADFQKICRDMHNLAEFMEIKSIDRQLIFSCKGEFCTQETVLCDTEGGGPSASLPPPSAAGGGGAPEIVQGVFSIKHLVMFTKCTALCNTLSLLLKNDYPIIIMYDVASLGTIKLCLAPQGGS